MKVSRIRFSTAILLMLVCALAATAQKPRLVLPQTPEFAGLCIDANLYIVRQAQEVIAYDMDSGEARWRYEDWPVEIYPNSIQGKHNLILGGTSNGRVKIVVLKMENGELLWERTERPRDPFRGMEAMQDSDWFLVRYARGTSKSGQDEERYPLLFSPEGKGPYRLPQAMWPTEWQEEGRTLLLAVRGRTPVRLMLWDLETGAKQDHCVNLDGYYIGRLHDGGLLVSRYFRDREPHLTVNVVDCDKGHLMREVAVPGPIEGTWLIRDGRAILMIGESGSRLWMVDADTNEVLTALHQPGHEFVLPSVNEDASGRVWIISRDTEGFGYLWAVEAGAAFRKVFDPGPFISGSLREVDPPHVITVTYRTDASRTLRVINFEKRCVVADYKVSKRTEVYDLMFSRSMQRCAVQLPGKGEALRRNDYTWEILEAGAAEPLLTLPDARMLTLSPDGEYLVAQAPEEYAELIHITSGESLHVFPLDRHNFRVYAAFAPDSRTLAVYGGFDAYTVVRISETGCTETPLEFRIGIWLSSQCFSPDGTRLLSATCGKAWLHDTTTGRLLHTLTEPQQLRSQHVGTPEVLGIKMPFVNYLGDLAGNFTNLANSEPSLSAAFIEDGAWALTVAEAQMIRVWDCRTGRSVHTIDMGLSNTRNENGVMENGVLLSGNGAYAFACNANDSQAILWDVNSGAVARKYTDWNREYRVKHVSDDGKSIYLNINGSLYWLQGR